MNPKYWIGVFIGFMGVTCLTLSVIGIFNHETLVMTFMGMPGAPVWWAIGYIVSFFVAGLVFSFCSSKTLMLGMA